MCGIVGICSLKGPQSVNLDLLKRMTGALRHRGPDESGIYIDNCVGLGHVRLSIIDISGGVQPIHNEKKTLWIVYNGEVYNYPELKDDLLDQGHRFYTSTDTEVILHLYEEKGPSCLDYLNGQFAFAIWDSEQKELFLARDRIGIRPLHYTIFQNCIVFSSEIKSIFMIEEISRQIDPIAMDQIFTFWTTLSGKTIFKDIHELPAGHYLTTTHNSINVRKYWEIPFYCPEGLKKSSFQETREEVYTLLNDAIRIRLRSDVPVGTYLSGGLDSSGITTLVKKNFNNHLRTFGIHFEEETFDESSYQNYMHTFLKTSHVGITATNEQIGSALSDVIWHCEKPLLRTAPVPLFLLSKVVRDNNFKVVLTGEGADEVFGGYNIFREAKVRRFWAKQPHSKVRPLLIGKLYPYILNDPKLNIMLQSFFAHGLEQIEDPFFSHIIRWHNTSKIKTFFSKELKESVSQYCCYEDLRGRLPESFENVDYLAKAQYLEMAIFLSNYLLSSQGDRVAMAHGVEMRLPYLDYRIINLMSRTPSRWKIAGLNEKYLLKKTLQAILPAKIINRPKQPYRAPIRQSLLNSTSSNSIKEIISDSSLREAKLFDLAKVKMLLKKIQKFQRASELDSMALAGIISSQIIFDTFIKRFSPQTIQPITPTLLIDYRSGCI